jgi:hypothetical protein
VYLAIRCWLFLWVGDDIDMPFITSGFTACSAYLPLPACIGSNDWTARRLHKRRSLQTKPIKP